MDRVHGLDAAADALNRARAADGVEAAAGRADRVADALLEVRPVGAAGHVLNRNPRQLERLAGEDVGDDGAGAEEADDVRRALQRRGRRARSVSFKTASAAPLPSRPTNERIEDELHDRLLAGLLIDCLVDGAHPARAEPLIDREAAAEDA